VLGGSGSLTPFDSLTVSNSVFSNNAANAGAPNASNKPGGGLSFQGGNLTLTNDTFSGNQSYSSAGSAVWYQTAGPSSGQTLTVTGTTFSGNATSNSGTSGTSGGALALSAGAGGGTYSVSGSVFSGNTATTTSSEAAAGGAIFEQTGNLTVTGSTFTNNSVNGTGGAVVYAAGSAVLHYNRITGNSGSTSVMTNGGTGSVNATENWWGCSTGPNTSGCDSSALSGVTSAPRLALTSTANPAHVIGPNGTSTLTASLLTDSLGGAVTASNLTAFAGLPVSFSDPPGDATVTLGAGAHSVNIANGTASIDYHSNTTVGPDNDLVTLDNGTVTDILEVDQAPTITSANAAHFALGTPGSFTVTTTGYPTAAVGAAGALPSGLTFHDNGNGSATISGTPGAATGGSYPLSLSATNGYAPNASQTLTVSVGQAPAFTSAASTTFVVGSPDSFAVTTSGSPTVSTITESGTLPAGITLVDNGNGTATLSGTATGSGGTYPISLTASNGISPNASQNFSIQVNQAATITLNPMDQTVTPGTAVSFTAGATGVPAPSVQWQVSTDNGNSFSNVPGATSTTLTFTAAGADNGNMYRAVFSNGVGSPATTSPATLTVGVAPAFTSSDNATFVVGSAGSFPVTATGLPSAALTETGAGYPAWLTLTDNGDGTGTLAGTPPTGSAGTYGFVLHASNGVGTAATQNFTLVVDGAPTITSTDHTSFTAGQVSSFGVTTSAGYPTSTSIDESGALPDGVTFHDNGDGTATLAGTPAAGTGGSYPLTITATAIGGLAASATQAFTLTVYAPPSITSVDHATMTEGSPDSFTVTTAAGNPSATTLTHVGTLPAGISFTDNGNGTASIAGTPNAGSRGIYTITITASNGVAPDASQTFTLTVNAAPQITSAAYAVFTLNMASAFTVTATGDPTPALSIVGTLPAGITFVDNADGTATLGGTPTVDGVFLLTVTASNGAHPDASQSFSVFVGAPPAISSADHAEFVAGSTGSFTVTTNAGFPASASISEVGGLPDGVTFTDNSDGTATLTGTPSSGGSFDLVITADNGVAPASTQHFTLTVDGPVFTTSDTATFLTGKRCGSYVLTTSTAGSPGATSLALAGALPSGLTFHDNGDTTATLSGCAVRTDAGKTFHLQLTASNDQGVSTEALTVLIQAPVTVRLPKTLPASDGLLEGVPAVASVGQVLHLTGSGYAPGAQITIGYYSSYRIPVKITSATVSSTGTFAVDITASVAHSHTFVVAGIGGDGTARFLEALSKVK